MPPDQRVCPDCGAAFTALGSEGSEQIDWQVHLTRIVHRRLRYRRACTCPGQRTVTAPPAANVIPKGRFTAAFLARLLYLKFVLGLPVHRIVKVLAAEGLAVPEGTLAGVLKALAGLLVPLESAIQARNAAATQVHADETTWRVYEQVEGKTGHKWWLWVFIAEDTVVFRMDATRSMSVLDTHFGISESDREAGTLPDGRRLVLSTDFYVAYQSLARLDGVDALWCWSHMRRYFIRAGDAHAYLTPWRDAWTARIADLYVAHTAMAAAEPGSGEHATAVAAFEQALAVIDTVRQQQMPPAPTCTPPPPRCSPPWTANGTAWPATATTPTQRWTTTSARGHCAPRSSGARTTTAATPSGPRTWQPGSGPSPPPPNVTASNRCPT